MVFLPDFFVGMKKLSMYLACWLMLQQAFGQESMKDTSMLKEAVIRGRKPLVQQRPDGIVVNVESSVLTKGSNVLDVLERSPGVMIDRRNNNIFLNGKDGVMVMLDGRLMRMSIAQVMTLLQGMSADDIEKIELLTTPPSKYDAEGSAGLINIVLKKNRKTGTNGNFSLTAGYGWREKGTASFNLAHNTARSNLYGSYTFSHDRTYMYIDIRGTNDFPVLGGKMSVLFLDTTRTTLNNHNFTAGWESQWGPKTRTGISVLYSLSSTNLFAINNAGYNILPDSLLSFEGHIHLGNRWRNLLSSLWLERKGREGEKTTFDVDYMRYSNNSPSVIQSSFTDKHGNQAGSNNDSLFSPQQRGMAGTTIDVGVIKIDYERTLSRRIKLEVGIKGTYTRSTSVSGLESIVDGEWVPRTGTNNGGVMSESIGAAYMSVETKPDSLTRLTIGGRYEYARTDLTDLRRRLGALFPSVFFSRRTGPKSELQLSYTKRISRPSYNDLASFVGYVDPVALFTGNPLLRPTITHNIKLGYNIGDYSFSLLASRDDHPIVGSQLTESPAGDLMFVSPQNMIYRRELTLQANVPFKVNEWWEMRYSLTGGWREFREDYTPMPVRKAYFGYTTNFSQAFRLPKRFTAELSGWYNSLSYGGTIQVGGFGALNAGVKKELKNDGGVLQLSVSDFLSIMQIRLHFGAVTKEAFATDSHVTVNTESRFFPVFKLSYSRSFGTAGKTQRKREAGAQDEMDRIKKN